MGAKKINVVAANAAPATTAAKGTRPAAKKAVKARASTAKTPRAGGVSASTARAAAREALATSTSNHPLKAPVRRADAQAIERLRRICLALPEATEKISWGEPTWRAGKIFAQLATYHHGSDRVAVWLPAEPGAQGALVATDPATFFVPPYVGTKGWIGVHIDRGPDWDMVATLVLDAFRLVAPPRLAAELPRDRRAPPRAARRRGT